MRLKIVLTNSKEEKIVLPIHYNHLLQAFIYNNIDKDLANFLHNEGYKYQKRNFKMFVFSRIFSKEMGLHKEEIIFDKEIYFFLSSPIKEFLSQFAEKLLKNYEFKIYKSNLN
ncbi:MAG: CRISPR-associated endoribonuclease Cas6, partial [candidate division WOR-3 bacterium]